MTGAASLLETSHEERTARARLRTIATRVGAAAGLRPDVLPKWNALVELLAGDAVEHVLATGDRSLSAINGSGVPVQFSVALGEGRNAARVLGEAVAPGRDMPERLRQGGRLARGLLDRLGFASAIAAVDRVLAHLLPRDHGAMRGWTGALWCGVAVGVDGSARARLYLNQRFGEVPARIERIGAAIRLAAGDSRAEGWRHASACLGDVLSPYGVAIDVGTTTVQAIKVYAAAQIATADAIAPYLARACPGSDLTPLHGLLAGCRRLGGWRRPRMVMPCLEWKADAPVRAKVDLALCALPTTDAALDAMVRSRSRSMGLAAAPYTALLRAVSPRPLSRTSVERLQYLSVGCGPGRPELTVYVSPDLEGDASSGPGDRV